MKSMVGAAERVKLTLAVMGVVLATAVLASCGNDQGSGLKDTGNPDAAPEFDLELFGNVNHEKGSKLRLAELRGKPAVVNFWYPSCPPCRLEMPDFEAASRTHKDGVEFIGVMSISLDTVEEGQDFIDEFGITYAVGPDMENTVIDYGVIGFPTTVFLDADHNIVRKWAGPLNAEKLGELIQEALP